MPRVETAPLTRDLETDVLVIGAGISGALVAEALSARPPRHGRRPPRPGDGLDPGEHGACRVRDRHAAHGARRQDRPGEGRARLATLARSPCRRSPRAPRDLGIASDLRRRDNLYLAGDVLDPDGLRDESEARRAAGLETLYLDRPRPQAALRHRAGRRPPRLRRLRPRSAPAHRRLPQRRDRPRRPRLRAGRGGRDRDLAQAA